MTDVATRERVAIEISDHVATVTLTRPEKHNALDVAMFEAISAAAERVAGEPGVRAVVLHGEGPSFCSGLDVAGVMANQPDSDDLMAPLRGSVPNWFQRPAYSWIDVAKELAFTGRIVSGAEAGELGLVTHVADDPLAAARELAAEIAERSPDAVRAAKRLYETSWPSPDDGALQL